MIRNPADRVDRKMQPRFRGLDRYIPTIFNGLQGLGLGGAGGGGAISTVYKLTFGTDGYAAQSSANLTANSSTHGSWGNTTEGVITNLTSTFATSVTTNKTVFATLTTSANNNMVAGRVQTPGVGNMTYAYFYAGRATDGYASITSTDKYTYSTRTFSAGAAGTQLATAVIAYTGVSNGSICYMHGGGTARYGATPQTKTEKMPIATETTSTVAGLNMSQARSFAGAGHNMLDYGYVICGGGGATNKKVEKNAFATETISTLGDATYSIAGAFCASWSYTKVYIAGGYDSNYSNKAQLMTISNETWAANGTYPSAVVDGAGLS